MLLKAHTYTKKKILMIDYYDKRYFFTLVFLVVKTRLIVFLCPVHYCFVDNILQLKVTFMTYGFEINK
jgi:hypothetical protein